MDEGVNNAIGGIFLSTDNLSSNMKGFKDLSALRSNDFVIAS